MATSSGRSVSKTAQAEHRGRRPTCAFSAAIGAPSEAREGLANRRSVAGASRDAVPRAAPPPRRVAASIGVVEVTDSWVQAEMAVNRFDALCIERKWPFVAAPANRDFGKDGYVDVSEDGKITGQSFFVQVKGGRSYASGGGYRIPVEDHLVLWRDSPAAVIGIVVDPADERPRWVNLTEALRIDPAAKSVFVHPGAALDDPEQVVRLLESVRRTAIERYVPLGVGSRSTREQVEAVWEAFAMGHEDAAPLIAVRRSFLAFDRSAARDSIFALSHCTPHPDIGWNDSNWLPLRTRDAVAACFRWSFHEVWQLLTFVDPERGMRRGTIGQCVFMLLQEDPDISRAVERVISTADKGDVLSWAAAFGLHVARENAPAMLDWILEQRRDLAETAVGEQLIWSIREHGFVDVMG